MDGGYLQLNRSKHSGTKPLHVRWPLEEQPEILTLVQQHSDEGGTPECDEDELEQYSEEMEQVGGECTLEREVLFENVGD